MEEVSVLVGVILQERLSEWLWGRAYCSGGGGI